MMWIGYRHADRLISYPHPHNLSISITYPRTRPVSSDCRTVRQGMAWLQCRSRASGPSYGAGGHKKLAQQAPHLPTPAKRLAQREAMCAISAKRLSQHAIKRPFWAILPALGKYFRAIAIDSRRWANFVAPTLLTAPQDETVDTNAETPGRPHETHDAFARENCAENRCIWLAMVSSVSPETKHTPAKAMAVSRELPAHRRATAVCCGGHRRDRRAWLRCPWAVAGPGRASRRRAERSSRRGRLAGGPPPTGTPSSPAPQPVPPTPGTPAVPHTRPGTPKGRAPQYPPLVGSLSHCLVEAQAE